MVAVSWIEGDSKIKMAEECRARLDGSPVVVLLEKVEL